MKRLTLLIPVILFLFISCTNDPEVKDINNSKYLLKNESDSLSITLKFGEEAIINDFIKIKFVEINDSRCPIDVNCIWAGNAAAGLEIINGESKTFKTLNSFILPNEIYFEGIRVRLNHVNPSPISTNSIKNEDYNIDLDIKLSNQELPKNYIQLIDRNNISIISADKITINNVSITGNELELNFSYSGGCKNHLVELFSFKEIEKTYPATVSLQVSHNADNDSCEAYITDEGKFDLNSLKDFLISNYNITDKVSLVIYDSVGDRTNYKIEYNF